MDITKLFELNYLFEIYPGPFKSIMVFLIFFIVLIAGSFFLERWIKKNTHRDSLRSTLPRFPQKLRTLGIIGLVLLAFRYEAIPYFSIRFFFLVYLLIVLWVIGSAIYRYNKILPNVIQKKHVEKKKKHYLPKKKRKN